MSTASPQAIDIRGELKSRSFIALLITQFLGAMNDNMFRWLVVPIASTVLDPTNALTAGTVCFTLPYLLLATFAGFLADRFDKRAVIVGCKLAEIILMTLGVAAIVFGNIYALFVVVALMGSQSALFGPSKFGSIPEILRAENISSGNGLMGLITVVASALGTFAGFVLYYFTVDPLRSIFPPEGTPAGSPDFTALWPIPVALIGTAAVGWLASRMIARLPAADPERPLPPNPVTETVRNLKLLGQNMPLLRTALGIAFFWLLASLAQVNINVLGEQWELSKPGVGVLLVILVVGVGLGSVLAGFWSGGRVELGIVPLGAFGIALSAMLLFAAGEGIDLVNPEGIKLEVYVLSQSAFWWSCVWLFTLGLSAGLFNIPLEAFLQHRSEVRTRGTILAASNFISFSFILFSAVLFYVLTKPELLGFSATEVFLIAGLGTIPVLVYVVRLLPQATIRFLVWLASHTVYRLKVRGHDNLPETGGALLVANHVSWLDGVLLLLTSSRPIRMLAYADYVKSGFVGWLARIFNVIPINANEGPKALLRSLKTAREAIENGELVCIFAEGQITRTGQLQPFQRGLMRIVQGTGAPVVPVYLDELWGSIFSFSGGKFFWKKPSRWPYPVSIIFGEPLPEPDNVEMVRQAVQNLGVESMEARKDRQMVPVRMFLRKCRSGRSRSKVADYSGTDLTGGKLLTGSLVFRRLLERHVLAPDEDRVGILLPPSVGGVIANTAVTLMRRVAVNINYTLSDDEANFCIKQSGIKHVLTSRKFLEKRPMNLNAELVFMEDLKEKVNGLDKLLSAFAAYVLPISLLERRLGLTRIKPDDLMTIIFTSGSTGEPKGVMLSHYNIASNVEAANQMFHISETDVLMGILPFFHSFGYTLLLWLVLSVDAKGVYHFNPIDARTIGKLCKKHRASIIAATPTFLKTYLKRVEQEQFEDLDLVIVGAEKLPTDLAKAFEDKFGVWPTEGFGITELSPLVAANVPDHRAVGSDTSGTKVGTVGRAIPGVSAKIVHPDTREDLPSGEEGLLLISGPNVMLGYLNQPEKTAKAIRDGWYDTGDIARIDDEGFIEITGRQSRFSKIGGEMVPHIKIEEILAGIVEDPDDEETGVSVAVTAVPDAKKGERLIVVHKPLKKPAEQVLKELSDSGLPNLWLPSRDSFLEVEEIPLLGTGKLDLKHLKQVALEHFSKAAASS